MTSGLLEYWVHPSTIIEMRTFIVALLLCGSAVDASEFSVWPGSESSEISPMDKNIFSELLQRSKRSPIGDIPLIQDRSCVSDFPKMKKVCNYLTDNSDVLSVLECLQSLKKNEGPAISKECQNTIWTRMTMFMDKDKLPTLLKPYCSKAAPLDCVKFDKTGDLTCWLDHLEEITDQQCSGYLQRVEQAVFTNLQLYQYFWTECKSDVIKYSCGRVSNDHEVHSQSDTLSCLQSYIDNLSPKCQKQVLHLSELQSVNIQLNQKLYMACGRDVRSVCPDVHPGSGEVYTCLLQYKSERYLTRSCQEQLVYYQKLIAQDYRVSHGLVKACKDDIKTNHCRRSLSNDKEIRLAQILMCLEGLVRNGTKISGDCQIKMMEHRKILMEDYRASPEIVSSCSQDISKFCGGLETNGKTIHCLMEHVRLRKKKERVSLDCQRALEFLVKEADVGEDWRVDPVLRDACSSVVDVACQDIRGGDARVMNCLMEKLGTQVMTERCESALLQIQYFVARDFKLDPQLYTQCRDDAVRLCHAKKVWYDEPERMDPERGPMILPCLYRYAYLTKTERKLKRRCYDEIRRVMRQRAISVDLLPDLEEVCIEDLAAFCNDKTAHGEEIACLQSKLERLKPACHDAVGNFTEAQAEHVELNPVIMVACKAVLWDHCKLEKGQDESDVMECLIKHKNDPDVRRDHNKCRVAIEHFQLISMKNYHFTYKFKEACRLQVVRFCPKSHTKYDVVACLSEVVRNDTLTDSRHRIPKECRQHLKAQLMQQRENVEFDPVLKQNCQQDIATLCHKFPFGSAQVLECLRKNRQGLSKECHRSVFKAVIQEHTDNAVDYLLISTCKQMIAEFCPQDDTHALRCLKKHSEDPSFEPECRELVVRRLIEQNSDYRLNPDLHRYCKSDIDKYCASVVNEASDVELQGRVVSCLRVRFREGKLTHECQNQVVVVLRDEVTNSQLNPLLSRMCEEDIKRTCLAEYEREVDGKEQGVVVQCLKDALSKSLLKDRPCRQEVVALIEESEVDIQFDPILYRTCDVDLRKYCADTERGTGRLLKCLTAHLEENPKTLNPECHKMLSDRIKLFKNLKYLQDKPYAAKSVGDLVSSVQHSPSRRDDSLRRWQISRLYRFLEWEGQKLQLVMISSVYYNQPKMYLLLNPPPKSPPKRPFIPIAFPRLVEPFQI